MGFITIVLAILTARLIEVVAIALLKTVREEAERRKLNDVDGN